MSSKSKSITNSKAKSNTKANKKPSKAIIAFIAVFVILIGALITMNELNKNNINEVYGLPESDLAPATREILEDPNYQNIILPEELDTKISNKESFFTYFFASDCPHCRATTPQLMPIADEAGVDLPQFNLKEFEDGWRDYNIEFTPTLVYFENGVEKDRLEGGMQAEGASAGYTAEQIEEFFTKYKGTAAE
ncbi:thioredoxin family protein [Paenibacillus sp. FSL H7-0326]|uniref:thioredoxin family protein n=1 Tax=Paenibacillus sp. FSL H7-0326 TaxID=1921144 RepID=UPI0009F9586C|nr:thioredoxin family protein [Paenibacillus sp. FSL H7-0326]